MIRKSTQASEIVIDLDGPNGNAFYLLKVAKESTTQIFIRC